MFYPPKAQYKYITDKHFSFFSIEFDRDCDYFAIAGVTKKIKVFEYGTVIQDAVDIHYPVNEMTCNSKIRYLNHKHNTFNVIY